MQNTFYYFRMCLGDFVKSFSTVDICHFVNTSIFSLKKTWHESLFHGEWHVAGRNGGSDWNSSTFLSNPQVLLDFSLPVKAATLIFISGCGSPISEIRFYL